MAGKVGNKNALKTGVRVARRLIIGELPKELLSVRREARAYRRNLEAEVTRVHGEVSTMHAHAIDTASSATVSAAIARWCLRHKIDGMNTSDVLACSKAILQAKQSRDNAVKLLGLDRPPAPADLKTYLAKSHDVESEE